MDFYGNLADADLVGDLFAETASHYQRHHLTLAGGVRVSKRARRVIVNDCRQLDPAEEMMSLD
jgi:hypothetical protein